FRPTPANSSTAKGFIRRCRMPTRSSSSRCINSAKKILKPRRKSIRRFFYSNVAAVGEIFSRYHAQRQPGSEPKQDFSVARFFEMTTQALAAYVISNKRENVFFSLVGHGA